MSCLTDCPACQQTLRVPDEMIDCDVRCPACNKVFVTAEAAPKVVRAVKPAAETTPPPPKKRRFSCPFCQTDEPPRISSQISQTGWIVLIVSLFLCFPLFFLCFFFQ